MFRDLENLYGEEEAGRLIDLIENRIRGNEDVSEIAVYIEEVLIERLDLKQDKAKSDARDIAGHMGMGGLPPI